MQITLIKDLTDLTNVEKYNFNADAPIDWLKDKYPLGVGAPFSIYLNNQLIPLDDYDLHVKHDDNVTCIIHPMIATAGLAGVSLFLATVGNLAISTAVSYLVGKIFAPNAPQQLESATRSNNKQSSVYNLNSQQNVQRLGQVIPVHYGRVRVYPSLIEAPYYRFENNEQYLYQLMCIGAGKYNLDSVYVSDTNSIDIASSSFRYDILYQDDFTNIKNAINHVNYFQRVRTVPELQNLEIKGTPSNNEMYLTFFNQTITFGAYSDGTYPDISSLAEDSLITISNSDSNDGTYTVNTVDVANHTITIKNVTLVGEPIVTIQDSTCKASGQTIMESISTGDGSLLAYLQIGKVYKIQYNSNTYIGKVIRINPDDGNDDSRFIFDTVFDESGYANKTFTNNRTVCNADFETTYGSYTLNTVSNSLPQRIEVDFTLPNGLYNVNSSTGAFEDRTLDIVVFVDVYRAGFVGAFITGTQISLTLKEATPYRFTESLNFYSGAIDGDIFKVRVKRVTPQPDNNRDKDDLVMNALKYIEVTPNSSNFGDITLLWVKAKATNALSSLSQFQVNTWVTRIDNKATISEAVEDIYTNANYGAGLPVGDLNLPVTIEQFNGSLDVGMPVFDAIKLIAKAGRYIPNLEGATVNLRKDDAQLIRTYLFNETNIIRDSLKIGYLFGEDDGYDSVRVKYRNPITFKEEEVIYPENRINPEVMELIGCTDATIALNEATYGYKQKQARKKIITFSTDIQGVIPNYMDRIGISHNMVEWGLGGQLAFKNGNVLDVAIDYDLLQNSKAYDTIIFISLDGRVGSPVTFTVSGEQQITLDSSFTEFGLYSGYEFDKTRFTMGTASNLVRDYIITNVNPNSSKIIEIKAINYDVNVYQ